MLNKFLKKHYILSFTILLLMALTIIGCESKKDPATSVSENEDEITKNANKEIYNQQKFSIGKLKLVIDEHTLKSNITPSEKDILASIETYLKKSTNYAKDGVPLEGKILVIANNIQNNNKDIYRIIINGELKLNGLKSKTKEESKRKNVFASVAIEHDASGEDGTAKKKELKSVFDKYFNEFEQQLQEVIEVDLSDPSTLGTLAENNKLLPEARIQAIKRIAEEHLETQIPSLYKTIHSNNPRVIVISSKVLILVFNEMKSLPLIIERMKLFETPDSLSYLELVKLLVSIGNDDAISYFKSLTDSSKSKPIQKIGADALKKIENQKTSK